MAPFQCQDDALTFPCRWDFNFPLVPGGPDIIKIRLKPERDLDITRFAVFFVLVGCIPGSIHHLTGPFCMDGDREPFAIFSQ